MTSETNDNHTIELPISEITIGNRHRKDFGDLEALASSITELGVLQPIGVTPEHKLVFGERRLRACRDILNWTMISAKIVNVRSILDGEIDENCCRKQFTVSEMVAVVDTLRSYGHGGDRRSDQVRSGEVDRLTLDEAAKRVGLGNKDTYYRAKKAVEKGVPEVVEAMDRGELSVAAAAKMAELPPFDQQELVARKADLTAAEVRTYKLKRDPAREQVVREQTSDDAGDGSWTITGDEAVVTCDLLLVDPPYGITDEPWEPADLEAYTREWASRWSGCGANFIAVFFSQEHMWEGKRWLDESLAGYEFQQLLRWHAPNSMRPKSRAMFKRSCEPIFLYRRIGSDQLIHDHGSVWTGELHDLDCHIAPIPQSGYDRKVHPCQKPVSTMKWLVNGLSKPRQKVVSLFCGSAPCGIAALQLGRRYHGIEASGEYRRTAEGRLRAFGRPDQPPRVLVEAVTPGSVVHGNCMDLIPYLPDGSVNLVVTSPPYAERRKGLYPGVPERMYPEFTLRWMSALWDKLTDDGSVLIVIDPQVEKGVVSDYVLRTQLVLRDAGWKEYRNLIWHKPDAYPVGHKGRPRHAYESILWFSKTNKSFCDPKACGRFSERLGVNGYSWSEWSNGTETTVEGIARLPDVISVPVGKNDKGIGHPAMFPVPLAEILIKTFCPVGGTVLDPFAGSGSALVAAKNCGRDFYGFDIVSDYCEIAGRRLGHTDAPATTPVSPIRSTETALASGKPLLRPKWPAAG